ncbi:MAG: phospholipase D-like domain-containing protein [Candidatus Eremiobacteraeota bacterium]|nr:phospholipase D-like domain-containing protein [Candidatus Eremiobacteraeota bacterium]
MIGVSSTHQLVAAIERSRSVTLSAYVLQPGPVLDALEAAAERGARVTVRLEGRPFADSGGELLRDNQAAVNALAQFGADARLQDASDADGQAPLHMKAAIVDGVAFLDDRNWPADGDDFIVRDAFATDASAVLNALRGRKSTHNPCFWTDKADALAAEARLLYGSAHAKNVDVESESFGYSRRVYGAIKFLATQHVPVRLLVNARDLKANPREAQALERLRQDGVEVRVCDLDEKMALSGQRAWLGSANATFGVDDQLDWGLRTNAPDVVQTLHRRFEQNWSTGVALTSKSE